MRPIMSSFLPMSKTERLLLVALVAVSAASFLPMWREIYIAGMSLFGWWMAALMILSPVGALAVFFSERKRADRKASQP
jgi:membrane protein YqaA with SNARE-associated domain